ncbi:MAG: caspase family protein, partial [Acidobacteria bacterium]|nr:caspase family protein [Acidobacteriota bacterium]
MTKKALLVAVGDYQGFAPRLKAPVYELKEWHGLLQNTYQFSEITSLPDRQATRTAVIAAFRALVTNAKAEDELLLIFGGHG